MNVSEMEMASRGELVAEILRNRETISQLQLQLNSQGHNKASSSSTLEEHSGPAYELSPQVLLIGGTPDQRQLTSVHLNDILARSYGRSDQREGDTPCFFTGIGLARPSGSFSDMARQSSEVGRLSDWSASFDGSPEGRDSAWRVSTVSLDNSPQQPTNSAPQPFQRANKPAPLNFAKGVLKLDENAIVSHQTLHRFQQAYSTRPLSPQSNSASSVARYIVEFFVAKNKYKHLEADKEAFARAIMSLCGEAETLLRDEPPHPHLASPMYVFGDIHGNLKDLQYFLQSIINFQDLRFTPYSLLFLGDYVDRGDYSVECIAYLLAIKVLAPKKVTLLRGNHEDTLVNGDMRTYGETSLKGQCVAIFGEGLGAQVWDKISRVFTWLPLTADIDKKIFCTHGGLPRYAGGDDNRMDMLTRPDFPRFMSFFQIPESESAFDATCRQIACDVCWSDPAEDESGLTTFGFGPNPRGNGVILFGNAAVDTFLKSNGYEFIFRAHQEKSDGVKVSKNARVLTIFSTSAYVGHQNGAGVVFVADGKIRLIIKEADDENVSPLPTF